MSSRGGRGYNSRGGSRGSSNNYRDGGSSSYRGSSRGRSSNSSYNNGSSSSRGGRYNNGYDNNFDSRGGSNRSTDRYSNRDDSYKRNHGGYSGSRDRSPDRKRTRNDQGSRRNETYGSSDYSSRNYEQYDKRDNRSSRNRSSPSRSFRTRDGSTSSHRSREAMGPPKSIPLRSTRGSTYRGRGNSSRGGGGLRTNRGGGVTRRTDTTIQRKRFNPTKSRDYYTRMLKIAKMRRSLKNRGSGENSSEERSVKTETLDEGEDWDKITAESEKKSNSSKKGDADKSLEKDDETEVAEGSGEAVKKTPTKKIKKEKNGSGDEVGTDKEEGVVSGDEIEVDDKDVTKEKGETIPKSRFTGKTFIKLTCIQCEIKCLTFKEYSNHLHGRTHKIAMRRLALRQKAQLSRMRLAQRNAQRDIEEKTDETLDLRPQFCLLCRLNYRQEKVKHQMSESHRNMKKFLMPFCSVCQISFKSPMMYEAHRCSLDHIMKKSRGDSVSDDEKADEVQDIDLDNFMTVDSVGDVDGHDGEIDSSGENDIEGGEKKEDVNLGSEHVKKVEVYYCDLCRIYLNRKDDQEIALKKHCTMRSHLRAYVRYRDDRTLRKAAERIHKKHNESKQKEGKKDVVGESKPDDKNGKEVTAEDGKDGSEIGDDKMWEDVDKDLGELLREVGPSANNDDEDDEDSRLNSERYDRFRNSEKNNDAKEKKDIEEVEKISTIVETDEITKEVPESVENSKDDVVAVE